MAVPAEQHFGVLRQGDIVDATFLLRNRSFQTVLIDRVSPNCDCAEIDVEPKQLGPLASASVRVQWKLGGSRGPSATELDVHFKAAGGTADEILRLRLMADVTPDVSVSHDALTFTPAQEGERHLSWTPLPGSGVRVSGVSTTYPAFTARRVGGENRVVVSFDPKLWPDTGPVPRPNLLLHSSSPAEPFVIIPLQVGGAD